MKNLFFSLFSLFVLVGYSQTPEWFYSSDESSFDLKHFVAINFTESGDCFIVGNFSDSTDFDFLGDETYWYAKSILNPFILKINSFTGELIWAKVLECPGEAKVVDAVLDSDNNLILSGLFQDSMDVDLGVTSNQLYSNGNRDGFVVKYNQDGDFLNAYTFGGIESDFAMDLAVDSSNQIIVRCASLSTFDLDPGPSVEEFTYVDSENILFLLYLTENLDYLGITRILDLTFRTMDVDSTNNFMFLTLHLDDEVNIDWSGGMYMHGPTYTCLTKTSLTGEVIWVSDIFNTGGVGQFITCIDNNGDFILAGIFSDSLHFFNGIEDVYLVTSEDILAGFVAKFDKNTGFLIWAKEFSGSEECQIYDVSCDSDNNIYLAGEFENDIDVDPGLDVFTVVSGSHTDGIGIALNPDGEFLWYKRYGTANQQRLNLTGVDYDDKIYLGGNYLFSVDYYSYDEVEDFETLSEGREVFLHKFSTCEVEYTTDTKTVCDFYYSNSTGNITYTSGPILDAFLNTSGCDSIVAIDLTVKESNDTAYSFTACFEYYWPETGLTYTTSGIYENVLTNEVGCDSTIQLNLIVKDYSTGFYEHGTLPGLFANDEDADWYQWLYCPELIPVAGETESFFYPGMNGNFALVTSKLGCVDTSDCYHFIESDLGIDENKLEFTMVPNPAKEYTIITTNQPGYFTMTLRTYTGQILQQEKFSNSITLPLNSMAKGVYFIEISSDRGRQIQRLVVN